MDSSEEWLIERQQVQSLFTKQFFSSLEHGNVFFLLLSRVRLISVSSYLRLQSARDNLLVVSKHSVK